MKQCEQNAKLSHRDFIRMMVISALSILLSLTALVSMSWAWFAESEGSGEETLTAAHFDLRIELDGAALGDDPILLSAGEYEVSLIPIGTARSGYCAVTTKIALPSGDAVCETKTLPIRRGEGAFSFTLVLSADTEISFLPAWGTAVPAYLERDARMTVSAEGIHAFDTPAMADENP